MKTYFFSVWHMGEFDYCDSRDGKSASEARIDLQSSLPDEFKALHITQNMFECWQDAPRMAKRLYFEGKVETL